MASDALFQALAQAKSRKDPWARALDTAGDAATNTLGGYLQGKALKASTAETTLKPYEIYAKLTDSAGPEVANSIFQKAGIAIPDMSAGSAPGASYTPEQLSGMGTFGQKRLTAMKTSQDLAQTAPVEFGQVLDYFSSAGKPEIGQSLVDSAKRSGKTVIQKDIFDKASGLVGPRSDIADSINRRTDLQVANSINRNVNALTSGNGALGQSGKNNLRIARVRPLLQKLGPLTPQELERINTDIDGVITGGVPLRATEEGQKISTIATEIAKLKQQFGNSPAVFNDAAFRARLVPLVNGLVAADNEIQEKAFGMVKANYGHLASPEHLARVRQAMMNAEQLPIVDVQGGGIPGGEIPGGGTGNPGADAAIQQILASGEPDGKKQAGVAAVRARVGTH